MNGTLDPSGLYCAYLRKSRKDAELEALGQGETLARHAQALADLAARLGISIAQTYREVVSGDTIAERPQMRALLDAVNAGAWDGVLCMDADRLGRGDSIDQGIIMQSFLYSGTLIVTPDKIYDPNDESDSEFFEIKLFFARREYTMIKKRMQRGRLASAMAGCYQSPRAPYGYARVQQPGTRKWTLEPVPDKAEIVRSCFAWYADSDLGTNTIARRLNDMGLTTDLGKRWTPSSVRQMLGNPTYAGLIRWNNRTTRTRIVDGQRVRSRPLSDAPVLVDGLHPAIVDRALFDRVQAMFAGHAKRPLNADKVLTNPLSGLILCDQCGMHMKAKHTPNRRGDFICCQTQDCPTCATYVDVIEDALLEILGGWAAEAEAAPAPAPDPDDAARAAARAQLLDQQRTLETQSDRLFDLLEQGVYTVQVYRQRRADLDARLEAAQEALDALDAGPRPDPRRRLGPRLRTVLEGYRAAATAAEKNALLRTVVDHIDYHKTQRNYRNNEPGDHLTLTIYPVTLDFWDE